MDELLDQNEDAANLRWQIRGLRKALTESRESEQRLTDTVLKRTVERDNLQADYDGLRGHRDALQHNNLVLQDELTTLHGLNFQSRTLAAEDKLRRLRKDLVDLLEAENMEQVRRITRDMVEQP